MGGEGEEGEKKKKKKQKSCSCGVYNLSFTQAKELFLGPDWAD